MAALSSPFTLRDVTFKNRIAVSPMSQYRAINGYANNWHLVHLGRFAMGGAALVYAEATAVEADGRRTHGDLGLWEDEQIEGLRQITKFISDEGAVPGIQLSHAGRKASERRPWHGETPVDEEDITLRGEAPWQPIAPSPITYADDWPDPTVMTEADIERVIHAFGEAARRAKEAGFKIIEVYAAHGFLVHQFLSPISNLRRDKWGGTAENRQRFAIEVARSIRKHWPEELPLAFRLSATDWLDGGIEVEDTAQIANALKAEGVDLIDCSSGGIAGRDRPRRMEIRQGFQVPFAAKVKEAADIPTMAVGFLWDAKICEGIIENGEADMIALARELLDDPNWPLHAATELQSNDNHEKWHNEFGWWLMKRDRLLKKLGIR
ncbi:NADH:flavin oxidoreductase/NADH oxidase [Sneathiella sp. P13V-1]|uniref:NADH:flavin oxidoreductase/NADH oxidase n=1 Tax=Sneathiella sp. P13V-1 TaxID=2697366 RepID=UPI00187B2D93|nr:NADH:flavin oxidoreductase/NADH oxidase [Sneathiella sp. P13V-1]MBE7638228.1 NADH:flavin oxidoreductase/NADH oxidase [Sneathiella sp. P13V-1]